MTCLVTRRNEPLQFSHNPGRQQTVKVKPEEMAVDHL